MGLSSDVAADREEEKEKERGGRRKERARSPDLAFEARSKSPFFPCSLSLRVPLNLERIQQYKRFSSQNHFPKPKGTKERERERKGEKTKKCPALPFLLSLLIAFLSPPLHCYALSPPPSPSVPRGCCRCEPLCHRPAALLRHCSCSGACGRERANKGGSLMDLFVTASPSASASLCSALASPCGTPAWRCALAAGALPPSCS